MRLQSRWAWAWRRPGVTLHISLTILTIIRIPPWHWLNHATYAFPTPAATDQWPDSLSQFMPPCDFCSLQASVSKFSHWSLLLPPPLFNSTNSLNERTDFLTGSLTYQVTYMGRVRPGYLLDHWQAELAAHSSQLQSAVTGQCRRQKTWCPMKRRWLQPLFSARGHEQEIWEWQEAGMLSSTPFPTSYNAVSRSKMLGAVNLIQKAEWLTSLHTLRRAKPVFTPGSHPCLCSPPL